MNRLLISLFLAFSALPLSSAPALQETAAIQRQDKKKTSKKKTQTVSFKTNMHCKNCVRKITENISFEKGVKDLEVSLEDKIVTISYDQSKTDESTLAKALEKLGYTIEKL